MPTASELRHALVAHRASTRVRSILSLFSDDKDRFRRFSARLGPVLLDYSKTAIDRRAFKLLVALAEASGLEARRDAMFAGARINTTENRAALHVALRDLTAEALVVDGRDVLADIRSERRRALDFAGFVRSGVIRGATGKRVSTVVNIGIGGSDLGPAMAALALSPYGRKGPEVRFVSNVDGAHLADATRDLDPARTMFIVSSKTFTTVETMTNAAGARAFIAGALGEAAVGHHFAAVSTNLNAVAAFGIAPDRTFGFWDWVGGRYSVWSSIGLSLMIAIGEANFMRFLAGAHRADRHFATAPLARNLPALMGLIGYWHRAICGYGSHAILPYDQRLARFPAHLQQLDMESLGKGVTLAGEPVTGPTGAVLWGEPGTNGQHAFFQLLHQGTDVIPCDFLVAANAQEGPSRHHDLLLANCLAQSRALMIGRSRDEAMAANLAAGMDADAAAALAPHKVFPGNRPSVTFLYPKLDPFTLGLLIALYEHKVFTMATLFGINAFDQWGVELGKEMAIALEPAVTRGAAPANADPSTAGLLAALTTMRG